MLDRLGLDPVTETVYRAMLDRPGQARRSTVHGWG